jgi:hypothetical protein
MTCTIVPMTRTRFAVLLISMGLILAGCASQEEFRRLDPGLNETALRQGKVAVLGVVKFQEPDQIRPPLIAMLERTFREERRDIPLIPSDSVQAMLGTERYRRILLGYEYQGKLEESALEEIADSLRGAARFVLLARIEKDRTRNSTRSIESSDTALVRPDFAMGVTGRDARVAVHLYDLTRNELVASVAYEGSSESSKPIHLPYRPRSSSGSTIEVGPKESPEDLGYPGAPELALALEEPFRTFARTLPGAQQPAGMSQPAGTTKPPGTSQPPGTAQPQVKH